MGSTDQLLHACMPSRDCKPFLLLLKGFSCVFCL